MKLESTHTHKETTEGRETDVNYWAVTRACDSPRWVTACLAANSWCLIAGRHQGIVTPVTLSPRPVSADGRSLQRTRFKILTTTSVHHLHVEQTKKT